MSKDLPKAYGDCQCDCHRIEGMMHIVPCCYPKDDFKNAVKRSMRTMFEAKDGVDHPVEGTDHMWEYINWLEDSIADLIKTNLSNGVK